MVHQIGRLGAGGHIAVVGLTASGKSKLSLELAEALGSSEIVSIDSMSVYRGMDIGTAKPGRAERSQVPHHLLDIVDPSEEFSLAQFTAAAQEVIRAIEARGHRVVLVGGTALYMRAVVDGLDLPGRWPEVRAGLEEKVESGGQKALRNLYLRLAELDPLAASRMDPMNHRRVLRALEVTLGSGRPFSSFGPGLATYRPTACLMVGVRHAPCIQDRRIYDRVQRQMAQGFLGEVEALAACPGGLSRTARQALGYRELLGYLGGRCSLDQAVDETVRRTRHFARRQWAWFRRDPRIRWVDPHEDALDTIVSWTKALERSGTLTDEHQGGSAGKATACRGADSARL
ncbi:MAG: tRNA (adenosine(37)-N6)-dimethylallyltransferase MiaA [Actinobacteria bacterium]|nr:tRNA (adenosine(37)-N6)-dimethylallyltransferase MiaA [Actinomycetota bacterium]